MIITIENVRKEQDSRGVSVVERARVVGCNNKPTYRLLKELRIQLSNRSIITIEEGFEWDLSSVPRFLWGMLPPDGDFELASLIHDWLYINKITTREFADKEMFLWSKAVSGTISKSSFRNLDNWMRYTAVKWFGQIVWKKRRKWEKLM